MLLFVTQISMLVGGATMLGAVAGFFVKGKSDRFHSVVFAFAGGMMCAAATMELIAPAVENKNGVRFLLAVCCIAAGAAFVRLLESHMSAARKMFGRYFLRDVTSVQVQAVKRVLLFVLAIAIHNFPEGLAAGMSCGLDDKSKAFTVALGIAIQNLPEGMMLIQPMRSAGLSRERTLWIALSTGFVEIIGTYIGWGLAAAPFSLLSYLLPFAGGTMLYIVNAEVIPDALSSGDQRSLTWGFFIGYCAMLILDHYF